MRLHGSQRRGLSRAAGGFGSSLSLVLGGALGLGACSNVDRGEADECQDDSDCGTGSVCSLAQGNICVPEELPPQAAIGFDIREGELRLELEGCDPEVSRELGGSELQVQRRSGLVRNYTVRVTSRRSVVNCGGNECAGVCDEETLTCSEPTSADLVLSMDSRLGRTELRSPVKTYETETEPPPPEGELPPPVSFTWPTYESEAPQAHPAQVLGVTPIVENGNLSPFRRVLAEDAPEDAEIDAIGVLRCQRGLFGNEGGVRTLSGSPVVGAGVEFTYAEPIAAPSTVVGTPPICADDEECPIGWACNEDEGSCALDLTGTLAAATVSTEDLVGGFAPAWVYTYCEGMIAPMEPIYRNFAVQVTPPDTSGLPNVNYILEQPFIDPTTEGTRLVEVAGALCLPDWQPPQPVNFELTGEPVTLIETELGAYRCCSTECIPSSEPGVEPTPPPSVESCSNFAEVSFETRWVNPEPDVWESAGCVPTAFAGDGSSGRYLREVSECPEEDGCSVQLTSGGADDLSRTYSVSIEQPKGSVFRSRRFNVEIDLETTELPTFELEPRVLLRGSITCVTADNCVATNAVVAAERLRVQTDEPMVPGPFGVFEARVDADGDFVLPLDPGVYVATAYPAVGQPGGPAPFVVVDLREDSPLIEMVDGVPNASLEPLQLDDGILVRVALDGFEVSTGVTPIDIGSWKAQDDFPAEQFDLNDPQTCHGTSARGCQIRRLRPTDAPISLLISKRFQFTARSRGGDKCE